MKPQGPRSKEDWAAAAAAAQREPAGSSWDGIKVTVKYLVKYHILAASHHIYARRWDQAGIPK